MTNQHTHRLGAQFPPTYHRTFLRYFNGEDGAGGTPTDPPAEPQAQPAPAAPAAPAEPNPAGDTPPWGDDFDAQRAWTKIQAQKADLDAERAKRAAAIKDAETAAERRAAEKAYQEIGRSLGMVQDDAPPTVESLTTTLQERDQNLTTTQTANAGLRAENAVLRYAGKHNGDADALLDSRDFTKKLAAIDSTADDYASQVDALVKSEIESNTRYRAVQAAPSNSNGNPITPPQPRAGDDIESLRTDYRDGRGAGI